MKSRWIMAFATVLALGAPRLPLADGASYEDRHPQETQKKGSTSASGTEGEGSGGMEGMQGMPGMQHRGADAQGKHKHTMMCSCPCSGASDRPHKS